MSISEEFKDQKVKELLEDYIALDKEIKSIPEKIRNELIELRETISSLPENIEVSITKLALSLEEAESSFDKLTVKHRAILMNQLDESKLELRSAIKNEIVNRISESIQETQLQLNQFERKVKTISESNNFINYKIWIAVIILSFALILSVGFNGLFYLYK
ncbi:hypothetical protein [Xenorhabdus budapestensis]|uniref:Uncharacterized protein n=1 Tax=Xenorhabdus budapestensis TaxID=290110 RepID=A0A2D0IT86_XENBU|nr:hypothetical protein [Xenorhabdus budapestensis]PHM25083.1 hypothetical protein Xbud_03159 [Xenorhabdus budapestensis]